MVPAFDLPLGAFASAIFGRTDCNECLGSPILATTASHTIRIRKEEP
jgi:hypothetical protein